MTQLFDDLLVDPSSCTCECGAATAVCSKNMTATGYSSTNCVNGVGAQSISENECYDTFSASHSVSLSAASTSCGAGTVTAIFPDPGWGTALDACGGFTPGPGVCEGDDLCVPNPTGDFQAGLCVFQEGDAACPSGFPNKTTMYTTVEDDRSCPASCTCSGSGATCQVSITGYANAGCTSAQGAKTAESGGSTCAAVSNVVKSIRPGDVTVKSNGTCTPGVANLSGDVVPSGITTICCT